MDKIASSRDYRAHVGPIDRYDLISAIQFNLLTNLGLREQHLLLDIGCGSLRGGRLFIPYLLPGHYYGIDPEKWAIEEGIKNEVGQDMIRIKSPTFDYNADFNLGVFGQSFDFILAQSIFSHTPQTQLFRCLDEVRKVLKPRGIFAATFWRGNDNYRGSEWVYPQIVGYTLDFMKKSARENGLHCQSINWSHPTQQWVVFVHPEDKNVIRYSRNVAQRTRWARGSRLHLWARRNMSSLKKRLVQK